MIITFGKFKGWDTEDLAKAGEAARNYLSWGSSNLRSPKWVREFDRVLSLGAENDKGLMVRAIVEGEDISQDDAETYVREELERIAEDDAESAKLESAGEVLIEKYVPILNTTANKLRGLAHRLQWNWEGCLNVRQFSSPENYNLFVELMTKWDAR